MNPPLVRGLGEQIVDRLRDDIFSGRVSEGERLRETELAKRFEVSRSPIRDALKQLTWEGVVETDRNRGSQVACSAPDEIQTLIIPLRRTVETHALRLFFGTLQDADFIQWEGILERMKHACASGDFAVVSEQDIAFHRYWVQRSNSPDLLAIWSVIVARVRRHFLESHRAYTDPMDIYREHLPIIQRLKDGDLEGTVLALEEHIQ
ncbi:putative HTH-type transcriptional regulator YdfH [Novipirellula galeiformis]|uniref:Putative HTH-type transcriptional regulator YdfH n=1 Tax=Novipirellula galeiformis TaxID=2528004 RepID=A0A5C6CAH2_9BACT|nr:GntR family transcriptional regulator [Novipirellula galeiformis]TWU21703.1 putative HTH-type transcriptional regulator YdfH [Novipirellula galeiformis]